MTESEIREAIKHYEHEVSVMKKSIEIYSKATHPEIVRHLATEKERLKIADTALSVLNHALKFGLAMGESEMVKVAETEMLPFADAKWRKDKFKFDGRVLKIFSKNIASAIVAKQKEI